MRKSLIVFATLLTAGTAAVGEPPKVARQPIAPQHRAGDIVLASADVQPPSVAATEPAPQKRRLVRVTTCRCGDPQVSAETPEQ